MKRILCLAKKDIAVLLGNKSNLFWVFGFPVAFSLFFGFIFAGTNSDDGPRDMEIGLVDQDQSTLSQQFAERLNAEDAVTLIPLSMDEARSRVRKGHLAAALIIKETFSEHNGMAFGADEPIIQIMTDPSRKMQSAYLQGIAVKNQFQGFTDLLTDPARADEQLQSWRDEITRDPDIDPLLAATLSTLFDSMKHFTTRLHELNTDTPLSADIMAVDTISVEHEEEQGTHPVHGFQITFPQCILWGILGCASTFAVSIVREQTSGTFTRLCVGPVGKSHILAGKGLACFATCALIVTGLFFLSKALFHVPIYNLTLFILAAFCVILCFVGIMMFVCTLGKTEQSAGAAGWAVMMTMAMLGGCMVPLVFMPSWLQTIGTVSPVRWGIYALEGAIWRNFSFAEMIMPCGILLAFGAAFFTIGVAILNRRSA